MDHIEQTTEPTLATPQDMTRFKEAMRSEWERLNTFDYEGQPKWPLSFISPQELANAGFYYLLNSDRVQCAFCQGVICGWEPNDRPMEEHARHFATCPFLMEEDVGNIPIGEDPIRGRRRTKGFDVAGNNLPLGPSELAINDRRQSEAETVNPFKEFGVEPHFGHPKNPAMSHVDSRRSSFQNATHQFPLSVEQLAEAGFYYVGISDYLKCFHCDIGLCSWEAGDDPWIEHALHSPECSYLRLNKGQEFINACLRKKKSEQNARTEGREEETYENESEGYNSASTSPTSTPPQSASPPTSSHITTVESQPPPDPVERQTRSFVCAICMENDIGVVFLPCGHLIACTRCAPCVSECPVCRRHIRGTVRTFLA